MTRTTRSLPTTQLPLRRLVLVAGFIGQFGKMLAEAIIARVKRRRQTQQTAAPVQPLPAQNEAPSENASSPAGPVVSENSDKKKIKALATQLLDKHREPR